VADAFGLRPGQICVMIHCGSRGLGHQICTDHVRAQEKSMQRYGIAVPDRQLACAPVSSPDGQAYLGAMNAAANYARANRQLLGEAARRVFDRVVHRDLDLVYDISHNLAKIETHAVDGGQRRLCVHRKGATRALPPGHPDLPADLSGAGQPVLIPGSMGTESYVLTGVAGGPAFASTCHGAGRAQSRHQAATSSVRWRSATSPYAARPARGWPRRCPRRTRTCRRSSKPPRAPACAGGSPSSLRSGCSRASRVARHTSSVTPHDHPAVPRSNRSSCSDTAFGTAPTVCTRSGSAIRNRTARQPSAAATSASAGTPVVSSR
jgi:tRNA-splicing ligase RtcB